MTGTASPDRTTNWLLCRAGTRACGLPLESVLLTLRRPIVESWSEHSLAEGVAKIRGEVVPVVSLTQVLSGQSRAEKDSSTQGDERRLVLLSVADRKVGLSVSEVIGIRAFSDSALSALPPLLADDQAEHVDRLALLDGELLLLLRTGKLLPSGPADGPARVGDPA